MNKAYLTHDFLHKAHDSLPVLRNPDSTSALCLGDISNSKIRNKKHTNAKNTVLNRLQKGHLFTVRVSKKSIALYNLSWEQWESGNSDFLPICTYPQTTMKVKNFVWQAVS